MIIRESLIGENLFEGAYPLPSPKELRKVSEKYYEELSKNVDFKITPYYESFKETWEYPGVGRNTFAKWQISKDFFVIFSFNTLGKYIASFFNVVSESKNKVNLVWWEKYLEEIYQAKYYEIIGKPDSAENRLDWAERWKERFFQIKPLKETLPADEDMERMIKKIKGIVQRYGVEPNSTLKEYTKYYKDSFEKYFQKNKKDWKRMAKNGNNSRRSRNFSSKFDIIRVFKNTSEGQENVWTNQSIKENLNFERGLEPKMSIGIGQKYLDQKFIDETPWDLDNKEFARRNHRKVLRTDIVKLIKDYKGFPILVYKVTDKDNSVRYWASTIDGIGAATSITPQGAEQNIKRTLYRRGRISEALNFERGMDPKKAMGLGVYAKIKEWMDEVGVGVRNFSVKEDYSIDTDMDIIAVERPELFPAGEFPSYIRFNTTGSLDIDACEINSLVGCPKYVKGYFSCQQNNITTLRGFPETVSNDVYCFGNKAYFSEREIKEVCTSKHVQADDSEE